MEISLNFLISCKKLHLVYSKKIFLKTQLYNNVMQIFTGYERMYKLTMSYEINYEKFPKNASLLI